jgi:hypothetical protein
MSAGTIVLGGSVAQRPGRGGHTWVFLQYLLGFRELGWDVVLVDRLEPEMCFDASGRRCPLERSVNLSYFEQVMERFGLGSSYALLCDNGALSLGLPRDELLRRVRGADLLLNVNGFVDDEQVMAAAPLRVFLDIDPGFGQMWRELGLSDVFAGHDAFVTIGENIGLPGCAIPTCGLDWITTPQPVVLEHWPVTDGGGDRFTTVASWRGPFAPIEYDGETYGLRVHEWRRFAELPKRSPHPFEVALDIDEADAGDLALLRANGWLLADPGEVAADPWSYRAYVQGSKAELMVAKNMYVRAWSGWFSDRSVCYLASGRPVLAQDTGFTRLYAAGAGLLAFTTLDEAVAGAEELAGRGQERHARAAREIAEECFDSRKVLGRLLELLGARREPRNGSQRGGVGI